MRLRVQFVVAFNPIQLFLISPDPIGLLHKHTLKFPKLQLHLSIVYFYFGLFEFELFDQLVLFQTFGAEKWRRGTAVLNAGHITQRLLVNMLRLQILL